MNLARRTANIENLVDELIELYLAQVADLREYAQAVMAGEGNRTSGTQPPPPGSSAG
jgi:hypothetical protein